MSDSPARAGASFFRVHFVPEAAATPQRTASYDFSPAESLTLRAQCDFFDAYYRRAQSSDRLGPLSVYLYPGPAEVAKYGRYSEHIMGAWPLDLPPEAVDLWRAYLGRGDAAEWLHAPLADMHARTKVALFALFDVAVALMHTALARALAALFIKAFVAFPREAWFVVSSRPPRDRAIRLRFDLRLRDTAAKTHAPTFNYLFPADNNAWRHGLSEEARTFLFSDMDKATRESVQRAASTQAFLYLLQSGWAEDEVKEFITRWWQTLSDEEEDAEHLQVWITYFEAHKALIAEPATNEAFFGTLVNVAYRGVTSDDATHRAAILAVFERVWNSEGLRHAYGAENALVYLRSQWEAATPLFAEQRALLALFLDSKPPLNEVFLSSESVPHFYAPAALEWKDPVTEEWRATLPHNDIAFLKAVFESDALRPDVKKHLIEMVLRNPPAPGGFLNSPSGSNYLAASPSYEVSLLQMLHSSAQVPQMVLEDHMYAKRDPVLEAFYWETKRKNY